MLNLARILLALFLIMAAPFAAAATLDQVLARGALRVGVSVFVPWALENPNGELVGFEIDVAKKLAEDLGVRAEFSVVKWEELIPAIEKGAVDILVAGMAITPERALRVNFSRPYASSGITMATNLERTREVKHLRDLDKRDVTVAAVSASVSERLVRELFPAAQLRLFADSEQASAALVSGDVHALVAADPIPRFIALEHPEQVDVPLPRPLVTYRAGFAIAKGDADFLSYLDAWVVAREADTWISAKHRYWFRSLVWREEHGQ